MGKSDDNKKNWKIKKEIKTRKEILKFINLKNLAQQILQFPEDLLE